MLTFSSINAYLQIKIAEKMEYFSQMEFDLSSKYAKGVVKSTRHKAVVEVEKLFWEERGLFFYMEEDSQNKEILLKWSDLVKAAHLPRFLVQRFEIMSEMSLNSVTQLLCAEFMNNEVIVNSLTAISAPVFDQLAEIFNINIFSCVNEGLDPNLPSFPKFLQVKSIQIRIDNIPDEQLLQLNQSVMELIDMFNPRIAAIANLLLKQWFENKRSIDWLCCLQYSDPTLSKEAVLSGLQYSTFWQYREGQPKLRLTFPTTSEHFQRCYILNKYNTIFTIDRGNKRLMVFTGINVVIAQEYTVLEDAIHIEEITPVPLR